MHVQRYHDVLRGGVAKRYSIIRHVSYTTIGVDMVYDSLFRCGRATTYTVDGLRSNVTTL